MDVSIGPCAEHILLERTEMILLRLIMGTKMIWKIGTEVRPRAGVANIR